MTAQKSDIYNRLCKIRDEYLTDATNPSLAIALMQIRICGYLDALVDFGIITKKERIGIEKYWTEQP